MKRLIYSLLLGLIIYPASAQLSFLKSGPAFKEKSMGAIKLNHCANGQTALIVCDGREFSCQLFDEGLQPKAEQTFTVDKKYGFVNVYKIIETESSLVVVFEKTYRKNGMQDHKPLIATVIFDLKTGTWGEEKVLLNEAVNEISGQVFVYQQERRADYYVVISVDGYGKTNTKSINVFHFDSKNHLQDSIQQIIESKFSHNLLSVEKVENQLYILLGGGDIPSREYGEFDLFLGVCDLQKSKVEIKPIVGLAGRTRTGVLGYNPVNSKMYVLLTELPNSRPRGTPVNANAIQFAEISISTGHIAELRNLYPDSLNIWQRKHFKSSEKLRLTPVDLRIAQDGQMYVICENIQKEYSNGYGDRFPFTDENFRITMNTIMPGVENTAGFQGSLNDVAILTLDQNGTMIRQHLIPKVQKTPFQNYPAFYSYRMRHYLPNLYYGNQYRSFYFLPDTKSPRVFFNDYASNNENVKAGKELKSYYAVKSGEMMQVQLEASGIITNRTTLNEEGDQVVESAIIPAIDVDQVKRLITAIALTDKKWKLIQWQF